MALRDLCANGTRWLRRAELRDRRSRRLGQGPVRRGAAGSRSASRSEAAGEPLQHLRACDCGAEAGSHTEHRDPDRVLPDAASAGPAGAPRDLPRCPVRQAATLRARATCPAIFISCSVSLAFPPPTGATGPGLEQNVAGVAPPCSAPRSRPALPSGALLKRSRLNLRQPSARSRIGLRQGRRQRRHARRPRRPSLTHSDTRAALLEVRLLLVGPSFRTRPRRAARAIAQEVQREQHVLLLSTA